MPTDFVAFGDPAHCVGRERELAYLQAALHDVALGSGSINVLAGSSGIGKSRLLHECERIASAVVVLPVRCTAAPLRGHDLRSQIAELDAVVAHKPVAVLVDDAHFASPADLETLAALASLTYRRRLALVVAVSDDALIRVTPEPAWAERWRGSGIRHCPIGTLGDEAMELLVRGLLRTHGATIGSDLLVEIVQTAQGNPRAAIELTEDAVRGEACGTLVPSNARTTVEAARRAMSPEAFETLLTCSALGERFDDRAIVKVSRWSAAAVADALQEACDLRVLVEDALSPGSFSFRLAAVRKAIYLAMVSPKRRLLHERIVERLLTENGDEAEATLLANQWDALRDRGRAGAALARLGDALFAQRRFARAAAAYERAAANLDAGTPGWFAVARPLAECYERSGNYARVIPLLESVRSGSALASAQNANLLERLFFAYLNESDFDRARGLAEQMAAVPGLVDKESVVRNRLILTYAYAHAGRYAEARRSIANVDPDDIADDVTLCAYHRAQVALGAAREPLDTLLAGVERAAKIGQRVGVTAVVFAYAEGVDLALQHGDLALAEDYNRRAVETAAANDRGIDKLRHEIVKNGARFNILRGDLAQARKLLVSHLGWRDSGRYNEAFLAGLGVFVGMRMGDLSLVDAYFDPSLLSVAVENRDAELCGLLLPGFAEVMLARGMTDTLHDALATCVARELVDPCLSIQLCAASYAAAPAFDPLDAQVADFERGAAAPIAPAHAAMVRSALARRRGDLNASQRFARTAAAAYNRFRWRLYEAMALERAGDARRATKLFGECGAAADALRTAAGEGRKMKRASFGARLTAREREVARLVARKRTDRDIARALQISVRTVHHHVEAILSKLGVRGRANLTERLLEEPPSR